MMNFKLGEEDFITTKRITLNGMPVKSISGDSDSLNLEADLTDFLPCDPHFYYSLYEDNNKNKLPKRYIINKGATILFWDEDEEEIGL